MRSLRVLGSCGAWPEPGRACAGFLLEYDGFRVLLDLGYAALPRLLRYCPRGEVDAVVVTHRHPDHCADVSGLARVRYYTARSAPPIPLYCAPGVLEVLRALEPRPDPASVFSVRELVNGSVGPFELTVAKTPHYVPNLAVRLAAPGLTVVYTGDSGPASGSLVEIARDADLFIADATLQERPGMTSEPAYVMTAQEAAVWAARAAVRRLLLTHFWPGSDRGRAVDQARSVYDGEVVAATEDLLVDLLGEM